MNALPAIIDDLKTQSHEFVTIDQHNLQISASIGIGIYPDDASTPESLTICADDAMYRAKDAGRNRLVFASET